MSILGFSVLLIVCLSSIWVQIAHNKVRDEKIESLDSKLDQILNKISLKKVDPRTIDLLGILRDGQLDLSGNQRVIATSLSQGFKVMGANQVTLGECLGAKPIKVTSRPVQIHYIGPEKEED